MTHDDKEFRCRFIPSFLSTVTSLMVLKRMVESSPRFLFGEADETVVPFPTLLETTLHCYQKCILYWPLVHSHHSCDDSISINACGELFVDLVNHRLQTLSASLRAVWDVVIVTSNPVMMDAPLVPLEADSAVPTRGVSSKEEKEWMWQVVVMDACQK